MQPIDWSIVSAIGQLAGAAATFAAVFVSLWLARRAGRASLRVQCRLATKRPGDLEASYVDIAVANVGARTERITALGWVLRRRRASRMLLKPSVRHSSDRLPAELLPGGDIQFAWDSVDFETCREEIRMWVRQNRRLGLIYPRVHLFVSTASGCEIVVPVSHHVQLLFATGEMSMFDLNELRVIQ